jgi:hypothetical protein
MKLLNKSLVGLAVLTTCLSSFAVSSQAGLDTPGNGVVSITGTATGSCASQTQDVHLGEIDAFTQANGATGVLERDVTLSVVCTNPGQNWSILPNTVSFILSDGHMYTADPVYQSNPSLINNTFYVSLSPRTTVPGTIFSTSDLMSGVGTGTTLAKLTFGLSVQEISGNIGANQAPENYTLMATPTGTITNRGVFNVTIPMVILY